MKTAFSRTLLQRLPLFFLLTTFVGSAEAAYYPDFRSPFDFSLSLSKSDVDLQSDNGNPLASLDRISITVFTLVEPHIQFGFITGSSGLTLDNDPLTAGMSLGGYHAGLAMRSFISDNPQIGFHANYLYQETKDETAEQTVTLSWHEWTAGVSGRIILGQQLEFSAGWSYHDVDARQRASGTIQQTNNLALESSSQGEMGIAWHVRSGGRVGLTIQDGSYQQIEFRFSREFR
jgi:hypothetical protein